MHKILLSRSSISEYDEEAIKRILNSMTLANSNIYLMSKSFED